jgi:hypothetical protein
VFVGRPLCSDSVVRGIRGLEEIQNRIEDKHVGTVLDREDHQYLKGRFRAKETEMIWTARF